MSDREVKPAVNVTALRAKVQNLAKKDQARAQRLIVAVAGVVVAQMLPAGVVKGGSAMKARLGDDNSRFTPDLDTARRGSLDDFVNQFEDRLRSGWNGFTGRLVERTSPKPAGVPGVYVMKPYDVRLDFNGRSLCTVRVELGHNEIGDADDPVWVIDEGILKLFHDVGLPQPGPIPVMRSDHQIAQKLHACTGPGNERAHDLVDLQLLLKVEPDVDLAEVRSTAKRLFAYRQQQSWPPKVVAYARWDTIYAAAAEGLDVLVNVGDAVTWANHLIERISRAGL